MKSSVSICVVLLLIFTTPVFSSDNINITFINPADTNDTFWVMVTSFMEAVAEDLNINLETLYTKRNHIRYVDTAKQVVNRKILPDYLIIVNEKKTATKVIKVVESAKVKSFLLINGFIDEDIEEFGRPREKYKYWIGERVPDNVHAGYLLGKKILNQILVTDKTFENKELPICGIAGAYKTAASEDRVKGFQKAAAEFSNVKLYQISPAYWREDQARTVANGLLLRYQEKGLRGIWAANDPMAIGALKAAIDFGKIPGKDIFIGGVNWTTEAIEKVKAGLLVATVGGHFMDGGWSLVMLHDYHKGKDFIQEPSSKSKMFSLDASNIDEYQEKFKEQSWKKIDFKEFSKVYNPNISSYDFSLDAILRNVKN